MKYFRPASVSIMVLTSFFLLGFKSPTSKPVVPVKKHTSSGQHNDLKPLDLTLPTNNIRFEEQDEVLASLQNKPSSAIPAGNQTSTKPIELQGRVIMSQEQEIEKSKSADGAGIIINLRH